MGRPRKGASRKLKNHLNNVRNTGEVLADTPSPPSFPASTSLASESIDLSVPSFDNGPSYGRLRSVSPPTAYTSPPSVPIFRPSTDTGGQHTNHLDSSSPSRMYASARTRASRPRSPRARSPRPRSPRARSPTRACSPVQSNRRARSPYREALYTTTPASIFPESRPRRNDAGPWAIQYLDLASLASATPATNMPRSSPPETCNSTSPTKAVHVSSPAPRSRAASDVSMAVEAQELSPESVSAPQTESDQASAATLTRRITARLHKSFKKTLENAVKTYKNKFYNANKKIKKLSSEVAELEEANAGLTQTADELRGGELPTRSDETRASALQPTYSSSGAISHLPHALSATHVPLSEYDTLKAKYTELNDKYKSSQKRVNALRMRVARQDGVRERAIGKALNRERLHVSKLKPYTRPQIHLKGKGGVVKREWRMVVRELASYGVAQSKAMRIVRAVLGGAGIKLVGDMSRASVARMVREGYVAAVVQAMDKIHESTSWTGSADGTTHRHVEHLAHTIYVHGPASTVDSSASELLYLGTRAVPGKSSKVQLEEFATMLAEFISTYNKTTLGRINSLTLDSVLQKLTGWSSDHAEDQKKFFQLLREWKISVDREARGEESIYAMAESAPEKLADLILEATAAVCGEVQWSEISDDAQREALQAQVMSELKRQLGVKAFDALPDDEKRRVDLLVWAGCAMHKELNSVKGGAAALKEFWKSVGVFPVPLMNRDNAATTAASEPGSAAHARAAAVSEGGAVKLTTIAGCIFYHHDDKKGQKDTFRIFFEHALGFVIHFPETSNTRFQTHCTAASALLVHLPLYLQFLELVRDSKEKAGFNNMENNVYKGLTDIPTLTELAVLALYAQAVSHPYMRVVRGSGAVNGLELGGFHADVIAHCERIIQNPDLLLSPGARYATGTLDGRLWERPEVLHAVHRLSPTLPHLRGALVAFFEGAMATWKRFSAEYGPDGEIARMTPDERRAAAVRATNCHNEGALGQKRVLGRIAPNMSETVYNGKVMYGRNETSQWLEEKQDQLGDEGAEEFEQQLRRLARDSRTGIAGKQKREKIQQSKAEGAARNRAKADTARVRAAAVQAKVDAFTPNLDLPFWESLLNCERTGQKADKKITDKDIQSELLWHKVRKDVVVTAVTTGTKLEKLERLVGVLREYHRLLADGKVLAPSAPSEATVDATPTTFSPDEDLEYEEEELLSSRIL